MLLVDTVAQLKKISVTDLLHVFNADGPPTLEDKPDIKSLSSALGRIFI